MEGDAPGQIKSVAYPGGMEFGAEKGHGYTVLPRMQGALVPAGTDINIADGRIQERDGYISFWVRCATAPVISPYMTLRMTRITLSKRYRFALFITVAWNHALIKRRNDIYVLDKCIITLR